jgi:Carboxypeptidase regulatory-like domain
MMKPFALATAAMGFAFLLPAALHAAITVTATAVELEQRSREEPRSLVGEVRSNQGQPLADAVVYLKNTKTLVVKTFITEGTGAYRFPALSPSVDYEVHAEYKGARSDTKTLSSFDSRKQAIIHLKINTEK